MRPLNPNWRALKSRWECRRHDGLRNAQHWLAYKAFRASLEPANLADAIRERDFQAWLEACAATETTY